MKLLPNPPAFYKGGSILFDGEEIIVKSEKEMQEIRGNKISMVFQDPMTSLKPNYEGWRPNNRRFDETRKNIKGRCS